MQRCVLTAPASGWVSGLEEAPDPVFAEEIMGPGLLVDPTDGRICAPISGRVISIANTRHAVTLRAPNGLELLIHIGIDTVALKGEGFIAHVIDGQTIEPGDLLITADLDFLAANAKSLQSPIIITNGEDFEIVRQSKDKIVLAGDFVMEIRARTDHRKVAGGAPGRAGAASKNVIVPLPLGLHARPAANIAAIAKTFEASITISTGDKGGNARSVVSIMGLAVRHGDELTISANGVDAEQAVEALVSEIVSGLGEEPSPILPNDAPTATSTPEPLPSLELPACIRGVAAAPGVVVGTVLQLARRDRAPPESGAGPAVEAAALEDGVNAVRQRLKAFAAEGSAAVKEIFQAHLELLDDPELRSSAQALIGAGKSAAYAWRIALREQAASLAALEDRRLAQRADDLHDLSRQVVEAIMRVDGDRDVPARKGAIIIADVVAPSDFVQFISEGAVGFCTTGGGATSHVAIMAASIGAPLLVAADKTARAAPDGVAAVLDAGKSELRVGVDEGEIAEATQAIGRRRRRHAEAISQCAAAAQTLDGVRIECLANLGSIEDAARAVEAGAEGCGLLRSEFLFLQRAAPPDEREQRAAYQEIADALHARPLVIRTLDIGGDKPAPYLPMAPEDNPALGLRGVRLTLDRKPLLETQLRAVMQVTPRPPDIMLPMVTGADEIAAAREIFSAALEATKPAARPRLGIMIETPASALLCEALAPLVDFFSIGSNDLTQYVLAMDRGNAALAAGFDGLHPAVLRTIKMIADAAAARNTPLGLCGALASDPVAIPILIGLGLRKLSISPTAVPAAKAVIRSVDISDCADVANAALAKANAEQVRRTATARWPTILDWN